MLSGSMNDSPHIPTGQPGLSPRARILVYVILSVLIVTGAWAGFRYAKLHLSLTYAHREASKKQYMRAEFWTGRALGVDPENIEATRLMAEIQEAQDKPSALNWRIRVVQRVPGSTADILAWAKCALRFEQKEMELKALQSLPPDLQSRSAEYQELMAGAALARNQTALAESYFVRATEIGRDNPIHRLNLATFRLANSPDRQVRETAAQDLEGMLADPRMRLLACRALLSDAIRRRDRARAQRFSDLLHSLPEHVFTDDLLCLESVTSVPVFRTALGEIEHRAQSDMLAIVTTGDWLNAHRMAAEVLRWYAQLPQEMKSNERLQMTEAESYLALRDWKGLDAFLEKCRWGLGEYLRRAMQIRCQRELARPWEKNWQQLVSDTERNPQESLLLAQVLAGWGWRAEAVKLLWLASTKPETESEALQFLWDYYSQTRDTGELLHVAKAQRILQPANPVWKNNDAFLTLLLYGGSEPAERMAEDALEGNSNVPEWAATYAYALHLAGKDARAMKVMAKLPPESLQRPGVALYYAIVLSANGDPSGARQSLAKLNPTGMLPEEQKLAVDLARQLNMPHP